MPDDVSTLIADLSDADLHRRLEAVQTLARLGQGARPAAVPLVRACGDAEEQVRQWAASALEELGPPSRGDREALAALLDDAVADVGYWSATLLGRLGPQAAAAVKPLTLALQRSSHPTVRQRTAWALGQIGRSAESSLDALRQATASDDPRLARLARQAIDRIAGQ
jgi:HEAT repeat protein